jgi:heme/copper-type cytochrome/quinol oxidase subunit 1
MSWTSLARPSRFFALAAVVWMVITSLALFRGASGLGVDVYFHDKYLVIAPTVLYFLFCVFFLIFAGVYGLFEKQYTQPVCLALGHLHFWLSLASLAALSYALSPRPGALTAAAANLDFREFVRLRGNLFFTGFVAFFAGQVLFLLNLGWSLFRAGAGAPR